jgi:2-polyprenyl-6-methoxyphenol hydroxylase-like FAD-dependent oxidoreductase
VAELPGHGDGPEQPGPDHRVGRKRHQGLLVLCGGDEGLAAVHVGPHHHDRRVQAGDDDEHREEAPRQLGGAELAQLRAYES